MKKKPVYPLQHFSGYKVLDQLLCFQLSDSYFGRDCTVEKHHGCGSGKQEKVIYFIFFKERITNSFSTVVFNNESLKIMLKKISLKMKSENKESHKELVTKWNDLDCDKDLGGYSTLQTKVLFAIICDYLMMS